MDSSGKNITDIEKIDENAQNITLGRYGFDYLTGVEIEYSGDSFQEEDKDAIESLKEYGNTIAKSIENFKKSVISNGGDYIGRYESRTIKVRNSIEDELTQITEKEIDQIYNIFDMASNVLEWTTETYNDSNAPCILRGGHYGTSGNFTSGRINSTVSAYGDFLGFRPILYINM